MKRTGIFSTSFAVIAGLFSFTTQALFADDIVKEPSQMSSATTQPASPLSFTMKDIDGKDLDLASLKGKVVLLVNVASRCGYTKQYAGLEELYNKYKDQGFVIVGVPANNFGGQEPGTDEEIKAFCSTTYNVTFPMLSKVSVKGDDICPLYKFLTEEPTAGEFAGEIGWNFTKFLIDRNGQLMARYASGTTPLDPSVTDAVEKALNAK